MRAVSKLGKTPFQRGSIDQPLIVSRGDPLCISFETIVAPSTMPRRTETDILRAIFALPLTVLAVASPVKARLYSVPLRERVR